MYKIVYFCLLFAFLSAPVNADAMDDKVHHFLCGKDQTFREKVIKCLELMPDEEKTIINNCGERILNRATGFNDIVNEFCDNSTAAHDIMECVKKGLHEHFNGPHAHDSSEEDSSESHDHDHHHGGKHDGPQDDGKNKMNRFQHTVCLRNLYVAYNITNEDHIVDK